MNELLQLLKDFVEYARTESSKRYIESSKEAYRYQKELANWKSGPMPSPRAVASIPIEPTIPEFIKWYEDQLNLIHAGRR